MASTISKIIHYIFKILFGLSLVALGIKNYYEHQKNLNIAEQSLARLSPRLKPYKVYLKEFLRIHSLLPIPIGIGVIFGIKRSKMFSLMFVFFQILLIDNLFFYQSPKYVHNALMYSSLLGSILYLV